MEYLSYIISGLFCGSLLIVYDIFFKKKQKIYRYPSAGWMDINKFPLPEDIKDYLATDGKDICHFYMPKYDSNGKTYFCSYDKTYITHWQPLPEAPNKKSGTIVKLGNE